MKSIFTLVIALFVLSNSALAQGPCNVTAFPSQMLQNSDFMFTSNENNTVIVKEITLGWPNGTAPGLDLDADHTSGVGAAKAYGSGANGWVVTSPTTPLGTYQFERDESGTGGCLDTVTVAVVLTLPVSWSENTSVSINGSTALIKWATSQQINNSHFEIEHSHDGRHYTTFGNLEGESNTTKEIHYEYIHDDPSIGINYYRIKQVDYDGQYSYSNVASVRYEGNGAISIYPNPTTSEVVVNVTTPTTLQIMDTYGRLVINQEMSQGENLINISGFPAGILIFVVGDQRYRVLKE